MQENLNYDKIYKIFILIYMLKILNVAGKIYH